MPLTSVWAILIAGAGLPQAPVDAPLAAPAIQQSLSLSLHPKCSGSEAEIVVCGRRPADTYRIDPAVLSAQRARDGIPQDSRSPQQKADVHSCHDEPGKCQGSGVIPLMPAALKIAEAAILAIKGEDWRRPFRTKPDEYEAYQQSKAKRAQVSIGLSAHAGD